MCADVTRVWGTIFEQVGTLEEIPTSRQKITT